MLRDRCYALRYCVALMAIVLPPAYGGVSGTPPKEFRAIEIARGESWVSPYWGYNTPKIVFDGRHYYTCGLWGLKPETAEGVVYRYDSPGWTAGARLTGIYQPATLALDQKKRLIVVYTRQGKPLQILRSTARGDIEHFDELPAPPDMTTAYYIGIAMHTDKLYLAYLAAPEYTMFFAWLDLKSLKWSPSIVLCSGQAIKKPKTAWTYPILYPGKKGLHFVVSNAPDGGEGNTYNEVWYLFLPWGASEPTIRERVAESQMGTLAYAMDAVEDGMGRPHIVYMWNKQVYGDLLPSGTEPEGTYHAWCDGNTGQWHHDRMAECTLAGLFPMGQSVRAIAQISCRETELVWNGSSEAWKLLGTVDKEDTIPAGSSFIDVLSLASGSTIKKGNIALVTDRLLPAEQGKPQMRVLWSLLPVNSQHR